MNERKHPNSRNSSAPYGMVKSLYDLLHDGTWNVHKDTPFVRMPAFSNYTKGMLKIYKESNKVEFVDTTASGIVQKIRSGDIANPIPQEKRCTVYGNFEGETMDELAEKISDACFFKGEPIKGSGSKDRCVNVIFQYFILAMIEMSDEERSKYDSRPVKKSIVPNEIEKRIATCEGNLSALEGMVADLRAELDEIKGEVQ